MKSAGSAATAAPVRHCGEKWQLDRRVAVAVVATAVLASTSWAQPAVACGTCAIGDPTLAAMGTEQPYRYRLRPSVEYRYSTLAVGTPQVDRITVRDQRLNTALAFAPTDWLVLSATLPVVWRELRDVNLQRDQTFGLGDLLLQTRWVLWRDSRWSPRHLLSLNVGARCPTAKLLHGSQGQLLPLEVQPGTGAFAPDAGFSYSWFAYPVSIYLSSLARVPLEGPQQTRASRSVLSTALLQYQPWRFLSLRAGTDTRWDSRNVEANRAGPDSGGFIAYAYLGLMVSPLRDWLITAAVDIPAFNALRGYQHEGPVVSLSTIVDIGGR